MKIALCALPLALLVACSSNKPKGVDSSAPIPATAAKDSNTVYKVVPLKYAAARELAQTLRGALATQPGRPAAQIVPDDRTNSLVITCAPNELESIENLIAELDVQVKKP